MALGNRWQAAHVMLSHRDSAPAPTPPSDPVDGLVRTHWTLAVCVVCGYEQPRGERCRAAARSRRPHTRPASSACAPGRPQDRWGAWERVLSRGGTASRAPLASGSPGPSVASVCDGAVAAFWFEQAYAYRSHAVMHALDLVSVELKLADDRGREVNPADA